MLFNSIQFVLFLALIVVLYNILPRPTRAILLLVAGYVFYAFNGLDYLIWLVLVTIISYMGGIVIRKMQKKIVLSFFIAAVLLFLSYFKYSNFLITILNDISSVIGGSSRNLIRLSVPIGISFYTFVAVGYLIDVYRRKTEPERNLCKYALFVSYFPAILSGPIERSTTLLPQLCVFDRTKYENAREGFAFILIGAFFKVVIADRLALCVNQVFGNVHAFSGLSLLVASLFYTFQIYFDFAGYSLMAMGVSDFFNIKLTNNFNKPYLAVSVTDFWRRWHISLTSWFRDYLYIPLGGNRVKSIRWIFNVIVVFFISGLWHGAYYTFIVWGLIHGLLQIIEKYVITNKEQRTGINRGKNRAVTIMRVILTFCLVSLAWVFFRASSIGDALYVVRHIFDFDSQSLHLLGTSGGTSYLFGMSTFDFALAILFLGGTIILELLVGSNNDGKAIPYYLMTVRSFVLRWCLYILMTFVILWFGKFGVTQFVYFNF